MVAKWGLKFPLAPNQSMSCDRLSRALSTGNRQGMAILLAFAISLQPTTSANHNWRHQASMAGALGRRALSALAQRLAQQSSLPAAGPRCGCAAEDLLDSGALQHQLIVFTD